MSKFKNGTPLWHQISQNLSYFDNGSNHFQISGLAMRLCNVCGLNTCGQVYLFSDYSVLLPRAPEIIFKIHPRQFSKNSKTICYQTSPPRATSFQFQILNYVQSDSSALGIHRQAINQTQSSFFPPHFFSFQKVPLIKLVIKNVILFHIALKQL